MLCFILLTSLSISGPFPIWHDFHLLPLRATQNIWIVTKDSHQPSCIVFDQGHFTVLLSAFQINTDKEDTIKFFMWNGALQWVSHSSVSLPLGILNVLFYHMENGSWEMEVIHGDKPLKCWGYINPCQSLTERLGRGWVIVLTSAVCSEQFRARPNI